MRVRWKSVKKRPPYRNPYAIRFHRDDRMDDREAQPPAVQDPELRRLVDCLPDLERHMVERVFFGGAAAAAAAREIDLSSPRGDAMLARGLGKLRGWLADPKSAPRRDPALGKDRASKPRRRSCGKYTKWGRCRQPADDGGACVFHQETEGRTPDPDYERQVVLGLKEPVQARFTESELHAMVYGRYRGDGRRIDNYVVGDPLEVDL